MNCIVEHYSALTSDINMLEMFFYFVLSKYMTEENDSSWLENQNNLRRFYILMSISFSVHCAAYNK